jgi:hypothetical protein
VEDGDLTPVEFLSSTLQEDPLEGVSSPPPPEDETTQLELASRFAQLRQDLNLGAADEASSLRYRLEFRAFMHREQFREHAHDVATLDAPFQCAECRKTFASAHDLWGHQTSVGTTAFACNYLSCAEVFVRLTDFAVHYAAHGGELLRIPASQAGALTCCCARIPKVLIRI